MLNLQSDVTISSTILIFYLTEGLGGIARYMFLDLVMCLQVDFFFFTYSLIQTCMVLFSKEIKEKPEIR